MAFPFTPASVLEEHWGYLSAGARLDAYERALREVVPPGGVVLDLGSGTGILGWLALRAGAGRVVAVDGSAMAGVARRLFAANGAADRVRVVEGWSREIDLPREFDAVVCDQLNPFALGAGLFESLRDAKERFLRPGGALLPRRVRWEVAPVEDAETWERVALWGGAARGYALGAISRNARGARFCREVKPGSLLGRPAVAAESPLGDGGTGKAAGTAVLEVDRPGTLHFLAGWFRAELSDSVEVTTSPLEGTRVDHRLQVLLPAGGPVAVAPGDRVRVSLRIDAVDEQLAWTVDVLAPGASEPRHRAALSDFEAALVEPADLRRLAPDHRPLLSPRGRATLRALALCAEGATTASLRESLAAEFPGVFRTPREAQEAVQEILERFTER